MRTYHAIVEHCEATGLFVAHVPDLPGAHTQAATIEELRANLREVLSLIRGSEEPVSFDLTMSSRAGPPS